MVRNTAREIAIHLSYELSFTDKPVEELLDERLTPESFAALAEEDPLYQETPNAKQADYIRRLVRGGDGEVHQRHPGHLRAPGDSGIRAVLRSGTGA